MRISYKKYKVVTNMETLKVYKEDFGRFEDLNLIEDTISIRKNNRVIEYGIENKYAMNQILDQVVNLSRSGYNQRGNPSAKQLPYALKELKHTRSAIKILIDPSKDTAEGISSISHFQVSMQNIESIYNQVIDTFAATAHFSLKSVTFELDKEILGENLPVDFNHLLIWSFGGNIPKFGSGMRVSFGFSIHQCSNWGIFYEMSGSLLSREELRVTGKKRNKISQYVRRFPKKGSKEKFLEKLPFILDNSLTDLKHNNFYQIKTMKDITLDSVDVNILLGNYVLKNKLYNHDAELVYEKWETETEHRSLWDLHQALTYTYTHVSQKPAYQKVSTDLFMHADLLSDCNIKKAILSNLKNILEENIGNNHKRIVHYAKIN